MNFKIILFVIFNLSLSPNQNVLKKQNKSENKRKDFQNKAIYNAMGVPVIEMVDGEAEIEEGEVVVVEDGWPYDDSKSYATSWWAILLYVLAALTVGIGISICVWLGCGKSREE